VHSLVVSSTGSMVGGVQQPAELTRFAFEPGCKLRMKITKSEGTPRTRGDERAPAEAPATGGNGHGGGKGKK
jgi:hypothetical protein